MAVATTPKEIVAFVNSQSPKKGKELLVKEIQEAVEEMKLIRAGKKKARNAEDFLNEL